MTWKGFWTSGTYNKNDVVALNFQVFIANQDVSTADPAPGAIAGSPKWSVVIPRVTPNYRGNWAANTPYNTGDLVMSGGQQVYSLTKDTTAGPYLSSTPPEHDTSNWTLVLDFSDANTANVAMAGLVISGISTALAFGALGVSARSLAAQLAAQSSAAMDTVVEGTRVFRSLQLKVTTIENNLDAVGRLFGH